MGASAEDDGGEDGANADSGVEDGWGGNVESAFSPVGGKSERDTDEEVHDPVFMSEFCLALGVHENDSGDAESAHDFDEDGAEPLILGHGSSEGLYIIGEPEEDSSNESTDKLEEPEEEAKAEVEVVG